MLKYNPHTPCPKCGWMQRKTHWNQGNTKESLTLTCECGFVEDRRPLDFQGDDEADPMRPLKLPPMPDVPCPFCRDEGVKHPPLILVTGKCPECKRHYKNFQSSTNP